MVLRSRHEECSTKLTVVAVHGGVSGAAKGATPSLSYSLPAASRASRALDAVEIAVRALEDDPELNAGFGAVLNLHGELELDAGIADGAARTWAGVAAVSLRHPISLARHVLENTPHVLLAGPGAMVPADGMEPLADTTPAQRKRWEDERAAGRLGPERFASPEHVDTVGAVALDGEGGLAAGSSTGGVFGQMPGRVGDAPVFGAGIYASRAAAVVGTGVGELFLETLACLRVGELIEGGAAPQAACESFITTLGARSSAAAGVLALDASGEIGAAYRGAAWAVEGPGGAIEAVRLT
jgi:beta-aspartyl-peptidase (threonine type)